MHYYLYDIYNNTIIILLAIYCEFNISLCIKHEKEKKVGIEHVHNFQRILFSPFASQYWNNGISNDQNAIINCLIIILNYM